MASLIIVFIHIGSDAMLDKIPPFKLEPIPLNESAKNLPKFKWASNEIGTRHQLGGNHSLFRIKRNLTVNPVRKK